MSETRLPTIGKLMDHFGACSMLALGKSVGLVDMMLTDNTAKTSQEWASKAGLKERYVRELLEGLTVFGYAIASPSLEEDPDSNATLSYRLEPSTAAELTGGAGAAFFEFFPQVVAVGYHYAADCFSVSGKEGIPYRAYDVLHPLVEKLSKDMFNEIILPGFVPALPEDMRKGLESGIKVADIGCGLGVVTFILAKAFPKSSFVGVDLSREAVAGATALAKEQGLSNVRFEVQDAESFPADWAGTFDLALIFDMILDCVNPLAVLKQCAKILKSGGIFTLVDIYGSSDVRKNISLEQSHAKYMLTLFHCLPLSYGKGGVLFGVEDTKRMLQDAGFNVESVAEAPYSQFNMLAIARKK